jgi:hypothetical protein
LELFGSQSQTQGLVTNFIPRLTILAFIVVSRGIKNFITIPCVWLSNVTKSNIVSPHSFSTMHYKKKAKRGALETFPQEFPVDLAPNHSSFSQSGP